MDSSNSKNQSPVYEQLWLAEEGGPCAKITGGPGHPQAHHPLAGWRLKANVYLDGTVRLHSAEFGSRFFGLAPFHRGGRRAKLIMGGRTLELNLNELPGVTRELRIGSFLARLELPEGTLTQRVVLPDLDGRELLISYEWQGAGNAPELSFPLEIPDDAGPYGQVFYLPSGAEITRANGWLQARLSEPLIIRAGYAPKVVPTKAPTKDEVDAGLKALTTFWKERFARLKTDLTDRRLLELQWALSLMIGTCIYDGGRHELACTNGALYAFNHQTTELIQPRGLYSYRDGNQVAFALVETFPEVSRQQILRNFKAFRHDWGIPQMSNAVPGEDHLYKTPGSELGEVFTVAYASDQVYWVILALTEYVCATGDMSLFDARVPNSEQEVKSVADHLTDMLVFSDQTVGYGTHGISNFLSGDWSDYLDDIGPRGKGESFMNAAMCIIAKERLAAVYVTLGKSDQAAMLRQEAKELRDRVNPFLKGPWFPRALNDDGKLVGGGDDRIFTETQSWIALAQCGTPEQRRTALLITVEKCLDQAGMLIMDRPLEEHERSGRTRTPYSVGTGENGGLWWQTGYWVAIALAQEGLKEEAMRVYDACSMANHHRLFPKEWWSPFMCPDGIDGPASPNYGRPQQPPGFNRESCPNEVAKFAYQLWFATHDAAATPFCWEEMPAKRH